MWQICAHKVTSLGTGQDRKGNWFSQKIEKEGEGAYTMFNEPNMSFFALDFQIMYHRENLSNREDTPEGQEVP